MSLILKNVSKTFVGKQAVDNISFILEKPGVFGLLGTNGAGKTTTIRMLLGIIKKETPYGEKASKKSIYSIEDNMFYFDDFDRFFTGIRKRTVRF